MGSTACNAMEEPFAGALSPSPHADLLSTLSTFVTPDNRTGRCNRGEIGWRRIGTSFILPGRFDGCQVPFLYLRSISLASYSLPSSSLSSLSSPHACCTICRLDRPPFKQITARSPSSFGSHARTHAALPCPALLCPVLPAPATAPCTIHSRPSCELISPLHSGTSATAVKPI